MSRGTCRPWALRVCKAPTKEKSLAENRPSGRWAGGQGQQLLHAGRAVGQRHVGGDEQGRVVGQAVGAQGGLVAQQAVAVNVEVLGAGKVGDAPAALLDEVGGSLVGALVVVEHHRTHVGRVQHPVKKYQRQTSLAHFLEVAGVVGGARNRHENALHLGINQGVDVALLVLHVLVRLTDHHLETGLGSYRFDAVARRRRRTCPRCGARVRPAAGLRPVRRLAAR